MDLLEDELTPARAYVDDGIADLERAIAELRAQLAGIEAQHDRAVAARHSLEMLHRLVTRVNVRLGRTLSGWDDVARSATEHEQVPIKRAHDRFHELAAQIRAVS